MSEWMGRASCRGNTAMFYRLGGVAARKPALTMCADCPVQTDCLEAAMALGVNGVGLGGYGVWGGMTGKQRRELNQQRKGLGRRAAA